MREIFLAAFFLFLSLCQPVLAAETKKTDAIDSGVTVLIYHRFGEDKYPTTNIDVSRFREQLEYLKENDYQVIPLAQLVRSLKKGGGLPEKAVVITMDDGYRSVYEKAWPVLREYGYPFTVFLYVKATDISHWNYMTWDQVKEMKGAGVDFQNHGYAHEHMAFIPDGMDKDAYRAWLRKDLEISTKIMTEKLDERPRYFALPYGEYNRTVLDEIRSFGFEAILLQDPGSVSRDTSLFAIPREPILGYDWSTMEHFRTALERVDLPVSDEDPPPGLLANNTPARFSAELLYPERYVPGTLGIYVSELGWHKATLDANIACISNSTPLNRKVNRVAISGREKESGRTAIRFWMLVGK